MATLEDKSLWEAENDDDIGQDILRLSPEEVNNRTRLLENDVKVKYLFCNVKRIKATNYLLYNNRS